MPPADPGGPRDATPRGAAPAATPDPRAGAAARLGESARGPRASARRRSRASRATRVTSAAGRRLPANACSALAYGSTTARAIGSISRALRRISRADERGRARARGEVSSGVQNRPARRASAPSPGPASEQRERSREDQRQPDGREPPEEPRRDPGGERPPRPKASRLCSPWRASASRRPVSSPPRRCALQRDAEAEQRREQEARCGTPSGSAPGRRSRASRAAGLP